MNISEDQSTRPGILGAVDHLKRICNIADDPTDHKLPKLRELDKRSEDVLNWFSTNRGFIAGLSDMERTMIRNFYTEATKDASDKRNQALFLYGLPFIKSRFRNAGMSSYENGIKSLESIQQIYQSKIDAAKATVDETKKRIDQSHDWINKNIGLVGDNKLPFESSRAKVDEKYLYTRKTLNCILIKKPSKNIKV